MDYKTNEDFPDQPLMFKTYIGVTGEEKEVEESINLASNIFKIPHKDNHLGNRLTFPTYRNFLKFIVYKVCLPDMMEKSYSLRKAIVAKKEDIKEEAKKIKRDNFIRKAYWGYGASYGVNDDNHYYKTQRIVK